LKEAEIIQRIGKIAKTIRIAAMTSRVPMLKRRRALADERSR
jgi:hypothetical protein